jgi:hypothetical protein
MLIRALTSQPRRAINQRQYRRTFERNSMKLIKKDAPPPAKKPGPAGLLDSLNVEPGDSILCDTPSQMTNVYIAMKRKGWKAASRSRGGVFKVYRLK